MSPLSHSLPVYIGPYSVGTIDLEIPVPKKAYGTAVLKSNGQPALLVETILMTLYYPCETPKTSTKHMYWVQRPLSQTARGYAKLVSKPSWLLLPALWLVGRNTRLPAAVDAPIAAKTTTNAETVKEEEKPKAWPTMLFSHGLSGTRTTYSQYCGEMASRGYVVASIEHRDGSGPITVVRQEDGKEREVLYLNVDDLEFPPPHKKLSQMEFRDEQLSLRLAEVEHAVEILRDINDGRGEDVFRKSRRGEGASLSGFKGRLDLGSNFFMTGHSFGGATTLQVLRAGKKRFDFARGVTLDPWTDPIPPAVSDMLTRSRTNESVAASSPTASARPTREDSRSVGTEIVDPLLVINSEAFTLWTKHFYRVRDIVRSVRPDAETWFLTLVGSIHISFSDIPIISPYLVKRYGGARVDAAGAIVSVCEATDEFLSGRGKQGKILGRQVLPGDEDNKREGEPPMQGPGEMRMHLRPHL